MMDIRFRAWDKDSKKMFKIARFDFSDYTIYSHLFACDGYLGESCEIMQYTGLKDKNGVEIFEGDWIRVETQAKDNGEFPIGYVVRANDKPEMFIALPEQHKETGERQYHLENLYKHYSDEFEVIGNIYENSDLMEVTA